MSEAYIRQIIKGLKCSKSRREEIRRQLESDIKAAEENGEKIENILKRMGSASEIVQEFNSSFSKDEQNKYKKEKWIKRLAVTAVILAVLIIAVYWFLPKGKAIEESDIFQKEEVEERARQVINLLNEEDYETLAQESDEQLRPVMTKEYMEKAKDSLHSDWGEFQSFGNSYIAQVTQKGQTMAVVQMNASYENISITYTISFNMDMKLAGLYMK